MKNKYVFYLNVPFSWNKGEGFFQAGGLYWFWSPYTAGDFEYIELYGNGK